MNPITTPESNACFSTISRVLAMLVLVAGSGLLISAPAEATLAPVQMATVDTEASVPIESTDWYREAYGAVTPAETVAAYDR